MKAAMASKPETSTLALESGSQPFEKPGRLGFYLLTIGICFSVLLVSLDRTIVATVRSPISAELMFHGNNPLTSPTLRPSPTSPTSFTLSTM